MKKLIILCIITLLGFSCAPTIKLTDVNDPTKTKVMKIQKKNFKVERDYTFITSKKGSRHMIYRDMYILEIIK